MNLETGNTGRRSFLKFFGLGSIAAATPMVAAMAVEKIDPKEDYLVKEWSEDGITFLEYLLPASVPAVFSTGDKAKTIHCPMHRVGKVVGTELIDVDKSSTVTDGHQSFDNVVMRPYLHHEVTDKLLIAQIVNCAKMHIESDKWPTAYVYMIRIKEHPELFGVFMNQKKFAIDADNYACYRKIEQVNASTFNIFTDSSDRQDETMLGDPEFLVSLAKNLNRP